MHAAHFAAEDIRQIGTISVTGPVRTCWDLAQWLDLVEYARDHRSDRGARKFARAVVLSDGRAESVPETRVRVLLTLPGLRPPEVQYTIIAQNGAFIARVDLAWPELKIAVEYDGLWHVGSSRQMNYDRRRLNRLISEGWLVLFVTAPRLRDDVDGLVKELRAAIRGRKVEARKAQARNAGAREDSM